MRIKFISFLLLPIVLALANITLQVASYGVHFICYPKEMSNIPKDIFFSTEWQQKLIQLKKENLPPEEFRKKREEILRQRRILDAVRGIQDTVGFCYLMPVTFFVWAFPYFGFLVMWAIDASNIYLRAPTFPNYLKVTLISSIGWIVIGLIVCIFLWVFKRKNLK